MFRSLTNHYARLGLYGHVKSTCRMFSKKQGGSGHDDIFLLWEAIGALLEGQKLTECIVTLERALERCHGSRASVEYAVLYLMHYCHKRSTLPDYDTIDRLDQQLRKFSNTEVKTRSTLEIASFLWHAGQHRSAHRLLRKALEASSSSSPSSSSLEGGWSLLGWIYLTSGQKDLIVKSRDIFESRCSDKEVQAQLGLAKYHTYHGDLERARLVVDATVVYAPWFLPAQTEKARLQILMDDWPSAMETLQSHVFPADPLDVEALRLSALYHAAYSGDLNSTLQCLERLQESLGRHEKENYALRASVVRPIARLVAVGGAATVAGSTARRVVKKCFELVVQAMKARKAALKVSTSALPPALQLERADLLFMLGKYKEAENTYEQLASAAATDHDGDGIPDEISGAGAFLGLVECFLVTGRWQEARGQLDFLTMMGEDGAGVGPSDRGRLSLVDAQCQAAMANIANGGGDRGRMNRGGDGDSLMSGAVSGEDGTVLGKLCDAGYRHWRGVYCGRRSADKTFAAAASEIGEWGRGGAGNDDNDTNARVRTGIYMDPLEPPEDVIGAGGEGGSMDGGDGVGPMKFQWAGEGRSCRGAMIDIFHFYTRLDARVALSLGCSLLSQGRASSSSSSSSLSSSSSSSSTLGGEIHDGGGQTVALRECSRVLSSLCFFVPSCSRALLLLAQAQYSMGNSGRALKMVNRCLMVDESFTPAYVLSARISAASGDTAGASVALGQALAHDFSVRDSLAFALLKGRLLRRQGRLEAARTLLERARDKEKEDEKKERTGNNNNNNNNNSNNRKQREGKGKGNGGSSSSSSLLVGGAIHCGAEGDDTISDLISLHLELSEVYQGLGLRQKAERGIVAAIKRFRRTRPYQCAALYVQAAELALACGRRRQAMKLLARKNVPDHAGCWDSYVRAQTVLANVALTQDRDTSGFVKVFRTLAEHPHVTQECPGKRPKMQVHITSFFFFFFFFFFLSRSLSFCFSFLDRGVYSTFFS